LSAAAVFFPVQLTIIKETNPDNAPSTQFNYTTSGQFAETPTGNSLTDPSFSLTPPNGTTSVSQVYYLQTEDTRSITESDPSPNFSLTNLSCTHTSGGLGVGDDTVNGRSVTLEPVEGESITCTFINAQQTGSIVVRKVTVPAGSSQSFGFTRNFGTSPFSLTDGGSDTVGSLTPGSSYSVAEDGVTGWTLTSSTCTRTPGDVAAGTISAIVVVAGQTTTCTFTNTRDQGYLKLTKSFDAKTSGFAGTFAVVYNCGAGDQTVNLAAGGSSTVGPFDTGTSCTVTEPTLPHSDGLDVRNAVILREPGNDREGGPGGCGRSNGHQHDYARPGIPETVEDLRREDLGLRWHLRGGLQLRWCGERHGQLGCRCIVDGWTVRYGHELHSNRADLADCTHRLDVRNAVYFWKPGDDREGGTRQLRSR
jgi:hypothetical protein